MRTESATYVDPGCTYSDVVSGLYSIIVKVENPLTFTPATQYCLNESVVLKDLTNKKNSSEANLEVTFLVLSGPSKAGQYISNLNELTSSGNYQIRASYPFYNGTNQIDRSIVINPLPAAPTVPTPPAICSGQTATLTPSSGGSTYRYYSTSSGGTALHTGTSFTTPALTSTTTYYVASVSAAGCESSSRTAVTVTVNPLPSAPTVPTPPAICSGQTATITPSSGGSTYRYYSTSTGGTALHTGTSFTTPALTSTTTYYVASVSAAGCESTARTSIIVTVNPLPAAPSISNPAAICAGQTASFTMPSLTGIVYDIYNAATGGTIVSGGGSLVPGATFTTPALSSSTTYHVEARNSSTGCVSSTRTAVTVTVNPLPSAPVITPPAAICSGQTATITPSSGGSTYRYYSTSSGGTSLHTGTSFTTPALTSTTTYYVASVSAAGCESATRTAVSVTVNPLPSAPVITPPAAICAGQTASFTMPSPAGIVYDIYNAATGGTIVSGGGSLAPGATFTTPALSLTTTYHVEARNSSTGCVSSTRTAVTVTVNPLPSAPTVPTPPAICSGQTATITPSSGGSTYRYYSTSSGGTALHTGTSFTTPALTSTTTYYVASVSAAGCESSSRTAVTVNVNPLPSAPTVPTPPAICPGQTATVTPSSGGSTYRYYSTSSGGTALHTGTSFTTPALTTTTTYYVASVSAAGCESSSRTAVTLTVNPKPSIEIIEPEKAVSPGTPSTTFAYTNKIGDPDKYSLTWLSGGATNVTDAPLVPDVITITGITSTQGSYTGNLIVRSSSTGCQSDVIILKILVSNDNTPPAIRLVSRKFTIKNSNETVTYEISDPESPILEAKISYGKADASTFIAENQDFQTINDIQRSFTISSSHNSSETGLRIRVFATNGAGLARDVTDFIPVKYDNSGLTIPYATPGKSIQNYRIISVPLNLERNSVRDVFGDNLGTYNAYQWRLFRYNNGQTIEMNDISTLTAGFGYWFISAKQDVLDTGPGEAAGGYDNPVKVSVNRGWNLLGNPYLFNLHWPDIKQANPSLGLGNLKVYRTGSFTESDRLNSFEGAFVFANNRGELTYPGLKNAIANSGRLTDTEQVLRYNSIDSSDWEVRFTLSNSIVQNVLSGFGMSPHASEGYDELDDFTLPRLSDYLELNHGKSLHGIPYSRDIVPGAEEWEWNFTVQSSSAGTTRLSWENEYFENKSKELILWHHEKGLPVVMSEVNHYVFNTPANFTVYYGDKEKLKEKIQVNRIMVFDPFPNPSSEQVSVLVYIPEQSISVTLYLHLINAEGTAAGHSTQFTLTPGYHTITWSLEEIKQNLPSGMYILQIRTPYGIENKKIIISPTH